MIINVTTSANPENVMATISWTSQCDENSIENQQIAPPDVVVLENRDTIEVEA